MFSEMEKVKIEFLKALEGREGFRAVKVTSKNPPTPWQVPLLSFYYVPQRLRGKEQDKDFTSLMTELGKNVKRILQEAELIDVSLSYLPAEATTFHAFFTVSFTNNRFTTNDIQFVLDSIEKAAEDGAVDCTFPEQPPAEATGLEFPNFPDEKLYSSFLTTLFKMCFEKGIFFPRKERVFHLKQPEELEPVFDFMLPMSPDYALSKMLSGFQTIIELSPHWAHPYFIYQLAAG